MKRSRKEIEDMFLFLKWAKNHNEDISKEIKDAIQNIHEAISEVELEEEEITIATYWFKEAKKLKEDNEILRKDLKELSKFVYGKENKNNTNT